MKLFAVLVAASLALLGGASVCVSAGGEDDYAKLLDMSFLFYEGQQSGNLPAWNRVRADKPGGWRRSAHLKDGETIGKDLSGGFYDAGDYFKAAHPLAWTASNLILSALEFPAAYQGDQLDVLKRNVKWMIDWLQKAHLKRSDVPLDNVFVGQVSNKEVDHHFFGRPEHHTAKRPVYLANADNPGADLAAEYAAAFAAAAVLFKDDAPGYAAALFKQAKQAYAYSRATNENFLTPEDVYQAYTTYWADGYLDDQTWAAAWMCKYQGGGGGGSAGGGAEELTTTRRRRGHTEAGEVAQADAASSAINSDYCQEAVARFKQAMHVNHLKYSLGYDWDAVMPGAAALISSLGLKPVAPLAQRYLDDYILASWQNSAKKCPGKAYAAVCYTPKGLAWYSEWGTLRNTGNMLFIGMLASKYSVEKKDVHACWVRDQMRYITGASTGRSFVIGYGPNAPKRPHHRSAACSRTYTAPCVAKNNGTCCAGEGVGGKPCCDAPNFFSDAVSPIVLPGALVGGPDQRDGYPDKRIDYKQSEVALDFNAGYTGALAGLVDAGDLLQCAGEKKWGPGDAKPIKDFTACGGIGDLCPTDLAGKCIDAPWEGYSCNPGLTCERRNQYFWICVAAVPYTDPTQKEDK